MSKKGLNSKNKIKSNNNDNNNIINNNNHNKAIVSINVNRIYFTHSRIRPIFTGCNKLITDTLEEIINKKTFIKNIPLITIIENNGNYFSLNNRRLYLFKMLAQMNLLGSNDNIDRDNNVLGCNHNHMIQAYYKEANHKEKLKYIVNNYTLHAKLMSSSQYSINNSCHHDDGDKDNHGDDSGDDDNNNNDDGYGDSHDSNGDTTNKSNDRDKTANFNGTINIDPGQSVEYVNCVNDVDHVVALLTTINNDSENNDASSTIISTTTTTTTTTDDINDDVNNNTNYKSSSSSSSFGKSKYEKKKKHNNNNNYNNNNTLGNQKGKETTKYNDVIVISNNNNRRVDYDDDNKTLLNIQLIPIIKKEMKNIDKLLLKGKINIVRSILDDWIVNNIINDEQYNCLCRQYNIL